MAGASRNPVRAFRATMPSSAPSSRSNSPGAASSGAASTPDRASADSCHRRPPDSARYETRRRTQQKSHQLPDIRRLTNPPHRMLLVVDPPQRITALQDAVAGIYPTGTDRIDPDIRPQADGHGMGQGQQPTLGRRVSLGIHFRLQRPGRGDIDNGPTRSEERRVGKECRYRWAPYHYKKKRD